MTVREVISEEMIEDLNSIKSENSEAARFAKIKLRDGQEAAEKSRKVTRNPSSQATATRGKTFFTLNSLLTNVAVEVLRDELEKKRDLGSLEMIDEAMERVRIKYEAQVDRSILRPQLRTKTDYFSTKFGPRTFLEELYFRGLSEGPQSLGSKSVNLLTLVKDLFAKRLAVADMVIGGVFGSASGGAIGGGVIW